MFLAIINDTYSDVKNDMSTQKSEFELTAYFKKSYEKMLDRLNIKRDVNNYFLSI
jgi:polycystin 2